MLTKDKLKLISLRKTSKFQPISSQRAVVTLSSNLKMKLKKLFLMRSLSWLMLSLTPWRKCSSITKLKALKREIDIVSFAVTSKRTSAKWTNNPWEMNSLRSTLDILKESSWKSITLLWWRKLRKKRLISFGEKSSVSLTNHAANSFWRKALRNWSSDWKSLETILLLSLETFFWIFCSILIWIRSARR